MTASRVRALLAALSALVWTAVVVLAAAAVAVLASGGVATAADTPSPSPSSSSASPTPTTDACTPVTASPSPSTTVTGSPSPTPTSASPSPSSTATPDPRMPTEIDFTSVNGFTATVTTVGTGKYVQFHNNDPLLSVEVTIPGLSYDEMIAANAVGTDLQVTTGRFLATGVTGFGTQTGCVVGEAASASPGAGTGRTGTAGPGATPGVTAGRSTTAGPVAGGGGGVVGGGGSGYGGQFYNVQPGGQGGDVPTPALAESDLPQLPGEEGEGPTSPAPTRVGLGGPGGSGGGAQQYGLPLALAAVSLGGVGSALLRVLLAHAPRS